MDTRLRYEDELLNISRRQTIIAEIKGSEEQARRQEAWDKYKTLKDESKDLVRKKLSDLFSASTVKRMEPSLSNISIAKKIINKLARVYSYGVSRSIGEDEIETDKLDFHIKHSKANQKFKTQNTNTKYHKTAGMFIKPIIEQKNADGDMIGYPTLVPMDPYLYSVVEHHSDRSRAMAYILSDFFASSPENYSAINPGNVSHQKDLPDGNKLSQSFDSKDQAIADSEEDKMAEDKSTYIFWSTNYHFTCNAKGEFVNPRDHDMIIDITTPDGFEKILNPIGAMTWVDFNEDQNDQYWSKGGKDLLDGHMIINCYITNLLHIGIIQGYGQLIMTGSNLPSVVEVGPDIAIKLEYNKDEDPTPTVQFIQPGSMLAELRSNLEMYLALLLTTNNLSTTGIATQLASVMNAASGIALAIDKSESQEDVQDQQQIFIDGEPQVWSVYNKWLVYFSQRGWLPENLQDKVMNQDMLEKEFHMEFGTPRVITSETEKLTNIEKRIALDLNTQVELIMKDRPGITRDQAEEILKSILEEKIEKQSQQISKMAENATDKKEDEPIIEDEKENDDDLED